MVGSAKLSDEESKTTLIKIEGVLNSRPLTYVYDEITDQPVTPSCLVIGRRLISQPESCKPVNEGNKSGTLFKRARYLERLLEHFRGRWKKEYLTGIHEHQRLKTKTVLENEDGKHEVFCQEILFIFIKTNRLGYSGV